MPQFAGGLSTMPRRRRVGRITLVKDRKVCDISGRCQIWIELRQKPAKAHRLVHHRGGRERTDISSHFTQIDAAFELLAREIEAAFHRVLVVRGGIPNQNLPDMRHHTQRDLAQNFWSDWNVAPCEHTQLLGCKTTDRKSTRLNS